jgi:hypothetical protein
MAQQLPLGLAQQHWIEIWTPGRHGIISRRAQPPGHTSALFGYVRSVDGNIRQKAGKHYFSRIVAIQLRACSVGQPIVPTDERTFRRLDSKEVFSELVVRMVSHSVEFAGGFFDLRTLRKVFVDFLVEARHDPEPAGRAAPVVGERDEGLDGAPLFEVAEGLRRVPIEVHI